MKPLKQKDFLKHINKTKDFSEYKKWVDGYHDYMNWVVESERKLSKHFGIPITMKDI